MLNKSNKVKYLTIAIILYMLAALSWWTVLLLRLNKQILELKSATPNQDPTALLAEFDKQKLMIVSEGLVFGLALIIGIYLLYRSYKKEVQLTQSQNNFLLSVTHELKTPLSVVKLINQTISTRKISDEKRTELLKDGEREINRLEGMVNNLLTSTKIDYAKVMNPEVVEIDDYIERLVSKMKSRWPNQIELNLKSGKQLNLDRELFETALLNILDNAFQYSLPHPNVMIRTSQNANNTWLEIIDNGVGIKTSEVDKIFNKFYRIGDEETRKTKGSGLGLYLSKEIINMHSGTIQIIKNQPKGSIFRLILPNHE